MNKQRNTPWLVRGKAVYDSDKRALGGADTLLIDGEIIREAGTHAALAGKYPALPVLDLSGCYLFPGLINTHVHFEFDESDAIWRGYVHENDGVRLVRAVENARVMLRSGVTTVRDAGSGWSMLDMLQIKAKGLVPLPRLQLAGPVLTVTGGHMNFLGEETDTADELVRSVRLHQKRGAGAVKIVVNGGQMTPGSGPERTSYTVEQIRAAADEAHRMGLPTFSHSLTTQGLVNTIEGGVQAIEHAACFVRNRENGLLQRVWEPEIMERYRGDGRYFTNAITSLYHLLDGYREGKIPCTPREAFLLEQEQNMCIIFGNMCELGFVPVLGTDAGVTATYFDETWLELAVLVERCGLTPAEAIGIATVNSAACLGLGDVTGRLAPGYAADIIALPENPLEDVRAFANVAHVISGGCIVPMEQGEVL